MKLQKILAIIAIAMLFSGCNLLFNPHTIKTGTLRLVLPDASDTARSLGPDIDFFMKSFDIHGDGPDGSSFDIEDYQSGILEKASLAIGTWTITVTGKNADGIVIGSGSGVVEVKPSSIARLTVELNPIPGKGSLQIVLDIRDNAASGAVFETSLLSLDGTVMNPELETDQAGIKQFSLSLDSGFYTLMMRALVEGIPIWGFEESVVILKDQITSKTYMLDETTLNRKPASPSNMSATWNPDGLISLRWEDNTVLETGYVVERKKNEEEANFDVIASLRENSTTFNDKGPFERGASYTYRVIAQHPRQDSDPSQTVTVAVPQRISVSGKLLKNQVWTSGNEYLITESILVPDGITLQIEPGVTILSEKAENYIKVNGTMLCEGTANKMIHFAGLGGIVWQGIKFTSLSKNSVLHYTKILKASVSIDSWMEVRHSEFNDADLTIGNTKDGKVQIVQSDFKNGISINGGTVEIKNCRISNLGGTAISVGNSAAVYLESNQIADASYGISASWNYANIIIKSNTFSNITDHVLNLYSFYGSLLFDSNEIENSGTAIFCNSYVKNITITNNYFYNNNVFYEFQNIYDSWNSFIQGNVVTGTKGEAAILLEGSCSNSLYNIAIDHNTFQNPGAGYEIKLRDEVRGDSAILNVKNNYWGTTDLDAIQSRIYDGNKFFELYVVDFDPPADAVVLTATPTAPADCTLVSSSAPDLKWKVNGWASSYKLQVASDPLFETIVLEKEKITDRHFMLSDNAIKGIMQNEKTYYWRVAPENNKGGYSGYSQPASFTVSLPVPQLVSPADDSWLYEGWNPRLEWIGSDEMQAYQVQVDDTPDFASPVVDAITPVTAYQVPFILPEGTTFYWRVRPRDSNECWGNYSTVYTFRIPLPGIGVEIETDLPMQISLAIDGPDTVTSMGGDIFRIAADITPGSVQWFINGEEQSRGTLFIWPQLPKGVYTLGVRIKWKNRSYSATKICRVVSLEEVMP